MMSVKERLKELGYEYEPTPEKMFQIAALRNAVRVEGLVFTSGQIPWLNDKQIKGLVGLDISLEQAREAAEICAFNCLRAVGSVVSIEDISRIVQVRGMVNVAPGFNDTSAVIHGCSNLLHAVFGERGAHARSAIGAILPASWAVEIEMVVSIHQRS